MKIINTIQRIHASGGVSKDFPTEITRKDFEEAIVLLLKNDVPLISCNKKYGCAPIKDCYYAEVPDSLVESIKKCKGFIDIKDYPKRCYAHPKEIGTIGNARIIVTKKKNVLDTRSFNEKPLYGIVFSNDLKSKGQLVLSCTL